MPAIISLSMHQATSQQSTPTYNHAPSHSIWHQSNTPMPIRTTTRIWNLASRNHRFPSVASSNHRLDGQRCRSCRLDIPSLFRGFSRMFFGKMMGRSNFSRLRLSRSISWERQLCSLLSNLLTPVCLSFSFYKHFFTNFNCNFEGAATPLKRKGLRFDFSQATPSPLKKVCRSNASSLSSPSPQPRS